MALKASEMNKLSLALDNVKNKVMEACTETITDNCENIYEYAMVRVPVQTGNLQSSLEVNAPAYRVGRSTNTVEGEVHFGELGHVGGWFDTEARTYMWQPGANEKNWQGRILLDGWDAIKPEIVSELKDNIASKFK